MFEAQDVCRAFSRTFAKTGKRMAARMAIIAITTSNSINVKPYDFIRRWIIMSMTFSPEFVTNDASMRDRESISRQMAQHKRREIDIMWTIMTITVFRQPIFRG
jgi:hypothetical protein